MKCADSGATADDCFKVAMKSMISMKAGKYGEGARIQHKVERSRVFKVALVFEQRTRIVKHALTEAGVWHSFNLVFRRKEGATSRGQYVRSNVIANSNMTQNSVAWACRLYMRYNWNLVDFAEQGILPGI